MQMIDQKVDTQLDTEQIEIHMARKSFYQLFHLLLSKPFTLETYKEIQEGGNIEGLLDLDQGGKLLYDFFKSEHIEESLQLARDDYFRLFIGPYSLPAPPWESVYRGKEHALFDFPTFEVRQLFQQFGLEIEKKPNQHVEAEDHIAFELEFMILLIEKTLQEKNEKTRRTLLMGQKNMVDKHLALWMPQFTGDIKNNASSTLFLGIADLLDGFIKFDSQVLNELLS
ncbi:putative component of anaerobic dehydrogenase [Schinkia azotoformans MEV2011]|uniref:Putative component of anaerobic dehydrogenase n=1 Tax=Schinkia azotoformans MEV2011 TaxID=1348973 RepID=A0A072NHC1_SCHAZ|nr:molecular chaperone TorD family protein [Schinkia azotoformans]KEF36313.1 putative component of anaerobic dehydrogenase [Schinkia azotoformans MEV2011]MEC1696706.1 molecular chaperone TorD family protein [Schinkia azotoformans]MEC1716954.1 molecular chaperone TorD family protein [Schinkia azotoformans]MEC1723640.1 molecular chaperone TorD family protein [Schinkia azotoformans]MEC1743237.1 molecular chaperone TorD family protein [Schinkia azotoformans]